MTLRRRAISSVWASISASVLGDQTGSAHGGFFKTRMNAAP